MVFLIFVVSVEQSHATARRPSSANPTRLSRLHGQQHRPAVRQVRSGTNSQSRCMTRGTSMPGSAKAGGEPCPAAATRGASPPRRRSMAPTFAARARMKAVVQGGLRSRGARRSAASPPRPRHIRRGQHSSSPRIAWRPPGGQRLGPCEVVRQFCRSLVVVTGDVLLRW